MSDPGNVAQLPVLRLKRNEDRRLHAGHLWIFSNEVDTVQSPLVKFKAGELVRVLAHNDRALGLAYVNPQSLIAARMLETWKMPDAAWLAARIRTALRLRERLYPKPYYRLVYGESDGLPGLVIDRYGSACVVQIGTAGMEALKPRIQEALSQVLRCEAVLFKNDSSAREMEGLPSYVEAAMGSFDRPALVIEDGLEFEAPLAEGQKTGWFFDQAANRRALSKYVRKGARVLDVFSYVGAWGVRAAHGGAREVICVDSSAAALELASANAERNGHKIDARKGDAFDVLEDLVKQGARFDIVVIDPPAFAKRKKDLPKALAAYKRLNQLAIQAIADDGILVSCSCSFHVSAEDLQDAIAKAARGADRHLQILEMGGQAPDHPVHPAIPETRYLKAYFCRVNDSLK
ncbi:MAG TPA: class I SAM-dependent rRNA methyltransferase [Steroidobacteraceae bacterium]|jgi:23S rRNA (cytosine1962-C5)-methyltransferase|nr:class I SAM-dependent rRNA methyltransferase [Steroidobacteraceae bacterium]